MKIICGGCNTPLEFPDLQVPEILNTARLSILVVEHPRQVFCLECKSPVTVGITGANLHLVGIPIAPQSQNPIVLAPGISKLAGRHQQAGRKASASWPEGISKLAGKGTRL